MNKINEFLKRNNANVPLQCFFLNDNIEIQTNSKELYSDLKTFFEPHFSVSNNINQFNHSDYRLKVITINDDSISELLNIIEGGEITHQHVGGPKPWLWRTVRDKEHTISVSEQLKTVVIQQINSEKDLLIITNNSICSRFVRLFTRKEIIYKELLLDGNIQIHSASVADKFGNGILIVGEKNAGKTSTLLSLIKQLGMSFVSNDLNFLSIDDNDNVYMQGVPEMVRIGIGTMYQHKELAKFIPEKFLNMDKNSDELWYVSTNKVLFYPYQISQLLKCNMQKKAKLNLVIFPKVRQFSKLNIRELSQVEMKERLKENIIYTETSGGSPWGDITGFKKTVLQEKKIIDLIPDDIPCIELEFDGDYQSLDKESFELYMRLKTTNQ